MAAIPEPQEWLTAYARVQQLADRDVLLMLRKAARDVNRMMAGMAEREGIGAAVRREQLLIVQRNLLREQAEVFRSLGNIVRARRLEAAARAIQIGTATDAALLERAGVTGQMSALRDAALRGMEQTVEVAVVRMTQSQFPLAERIYRTRVWMDGRVQNMVNSALARGLTAREFAKEAIDWFNPNTPGGVRYASMRLARTEINNAYHAISVNHSEEKPWVEHMKWHLSRSHPKPDECDKLAHSGRNGDGLYLVRDVPRKPHPQCFCYVTPVSPDEDEFLDALVGGKYDDYLRGKLGHRWLSQSGVPTPQVTPSIADAHKFISAARQSGMKSHVIERHLVKQFGLTPAQAFQEVKKFPKLPTVTPRPTPVRPTASKVAAPVRPTVTTIRPTTAAPTRSSGSIVDRAKAKDHVKDIVKVADPKEAAATVKVLSEQAEITPFTMLRLRSVRKMDNRQAASFESQYGKAALGGYIRGDISIHPAVMRPAYQRSYNRDVKSGWFSDCGREHTGYDAFIAHEYGHHVDNMMGLIGPNGKKAVWDTVGKELGIKPPFFFDERSLDNWVARNKDALKKQVSSYGSSSGAELLAEVWAEYSTNPGARPHIKAIGRAMQDLAERNAR